MFARHGPGYRWWAVVTVMLDTVSAIMDATVVNVALPEITRVFHVGHGQVQILSTGFLDTTAASMLLALSLEGRERQLNAVHGLQPMQEGFFLIAFVYCLAMIPAWLMTRRAQPVRSA